MPKYDIKTMQLIAKVIKQFKELFDATLGTQKTYPVGF